MNWTRGLVAVGVASVAAGVALWPLADSAAFGPGFGQVLESGIGFAFVAGGIVAALRRPENLTGPLMIAVGWSWWGHLLIVTREPALFTLGLLMEIAFVPLLFWLLLSFPAGRLAKGWDRVLVGYTVVLWVVLNVVFNLFFDPRAIGCPDCQAGLNLMLVDSRPDVTESLLDFSPWALSAGLLALLLTMLARLVRATHPARRVLWPLAVPAAVWAIAFAAYLLFPNLENTFFDSGTNADRVLLRTFGIALLTMPVTFLFGIQRARGRRARVSDLVQELGGMPSIGQLEVALRRTLGDPALRLGFRADPRDEYVAADGRPLDLPDDDNRTTSATFLDLGAGALGVVVHDRALLVDDRELLDAVTAAAGLAVRNEQLQAEVHRQLEDVRESRARIVTAADDARQKVERDLHDGAQQRLISLALGLRLAEARLGDDGDPVLRDTLSDMADDVGSAIEELRELARGLHPRVLEDEGLAAGLESLALRSPVPVTLVRVPAGRLPAPVEAAAYFFVAEALSNVAKYAHASRVDVRAVEDWGELSVEVKDDGIGGAHVGTGSGLRGLQDRVEAFAGTLDIDSPRGGGTTLRARIPCAPLSRTT